MPGVTPQGYERPTETELIAGFELEQRGEIADDLDLASDPIVGQLNGIYGRALGKAHEIIEVAYHAFDPDKAEDDRLENLGKLSGVPKRTASATEVNATVTLEVGTLLARDEDFAHLTDKPDLRFTPKANFVAPSTGAHTVRFVAETTGPIVVEPGQLTVIATPVNGWSAITNPTAGDTGHVADTNETLRERREESLTRAGSGNPEAIEADLIAIEAIESVKVLENWLDDPDQNGLPGHSVEAILWDNGGAADDNVVAQTIWTSKSGGTRPHGLTDQGLATDANGDPQVVQFTRAVARDVYLVFTVKTGDDWVGQVEAKAKIAEKANALFKAGNPVIASRVRGLPFELGLGAEDVTALTLGFTPAPVGTDNLAISIRQIPRFASARIVINEV